MTIRIADKFDEFSKLLKNPPKGDFKNISIIANEFSILYPSLDTNQQNIAINDVIFYLQSDMWDDYDRQLKFLLIVKSTGVVPLEKTAQFIKSLSSDLSGDGPGVSIALGCLQSFCVTLADKGDTAFTMVSVDRWFEDVSPKFKDSLKSQLYVKLLLKDQNPLEVISYYLGDTNLDVSVRQGSAITSYLGTTKDPLKFTEKIQLICEHSKSDLPLSAFVRSWMKVNSMKVSQWVDTLPEGKFKDSAIMPMIRSLDPEADYLVISKWLLQINDEKLRENTKNEFKR